MKTKIVYTAVSGFEDIYLPQALVASYTARKTNPSADILLVVDQDTEKVIKTKLPKIKKYVSEVIVVNVPSELGKMHRSRYLKTTLRQNLRGDFLYVDADTVIAEDLSAIDKVSADVAAVLDRHTLVSEHALIKHIQDDIAPLSLSIKDLNNRYFNGGVMYVKDSPIANMLYERWHDNWNKAYKITKGIDQPPLALANKQCGYPIVELDGTWNCQLSDNFVNYLSDAKILHYFASNKRSPYLLYDRNIFKEVLNVGDIPQWLADALDNPKTFFLPHHLLVFDDDVTFMRSYIHVLFKFHPLIFRIMEYFSKVLVTKKLKQK